MVFEVVAPDDRLVPALPGALSRAFPASRAGREAWPSAGADHRAGYPGDSPRPRRRRPAASGAGAVRPESRDRWRAGAPSLRRELVAALLAQGPGHNGLR